MFSKGYAEEIHTHFMETAVRLGDAGEQLIRQISQEEESVRPALEFLFASMPDSDIFDYPYELYRSYALHGEKLWKEQEAGQRGWRKVPEKLFANYVLHHRANNEDLADDRPFFYGKLHDVIENRTMEEAVLAVNYWLAQTASYQTTDDRTASGKTVYQSALGRCGEESVYAVTVYRSLGIPARQVYVPLWSHCDDNHAWVEVWCDGEWKFLGACEPEEILNRGWFTAATSRAMQVQSRWLGCDEPEDAVVGKKGMSLIINHLDRYALTKKLQLSVRREDHTPVAHALVILSVINYGAFGEIARVYTDENGNAAAELGYGSVRAECWTDGTYGEAYADVRQQDELNITVKTEPFTVDCWEDLELFAPSAYPVNASQPTKEQKAAQEEKLRACSHMREERIEHFYRMDEAEKAVRFCPDPSAAREMLRMARGNFDAVRDFFLWREDDASCWRYKMGMLKQLREKDFWDLDPEIMKAHMESVCKYDGNPDIPGNVFDSCILNPRIGREKLTNYVKFICEYFSEKEQQHFRKEPKQIYRWIQENVESRPDHEYSNLVTSPCGVLRSCVGSEWSKQTLCVAICRALGIPARLNPIDSKPEYYCKGVFVTMESSAAKAEHADTRTASLEVKGDGTHEWKYARSYSISRFQNGTFIPLNLEEDEEPHRKLPVEPGVYRVLTVNRLPNGNIRSGKYDMKLGDGDEKELVLFQKEARISDMLSENELPGFTLTAKDKSCINSESLTADGRCKLLLWLEEGKEPTEHVLNEMLENSRQFESWQKDICFVVKSPESEKNPLLLKVREKLPDTQMYYDDFGAQVSALARSMFLEPESFPLVLVAEPGGKGIYGTAGYHVGTGEMLLRIFAEKSAL